MAERFKEALRGQQDRDGESKSLVHRDVVGLGNRALAMQVIASLGFDRATCRLVSGLDFVSWGSWSANELRVARYFRALAQ
jgi:hypothetical protein